MNRGGKQRRTHVTTTALPEVDGGPGGEPPAALGLGGPAWLVGGPLTSPPMLLGPGGTAGEVGGPPALPPRPPELGAAPAPDEVGDAAAPPSGPDPGEVVGEAPPRLGAASGAGGPPRPPPELGGPPWDAGEPPALPPPLGPGGAPWAADGGPDAAATHSVRTAEGCCPLDCIATRSISSCGPDRIVATWSVSCGFKRGTRYQ